MSVCVCVCSRDARVNMRQGLLRLHTHTHSFGRLVGRSFVGVGMMVVVAVGEAININNNKN